MELKHATYKALCLVLMNVLAVGITSKSEHKIASECADSIEYTGHGTSEDTPSRRVPDVVLGYSSVFTDLPPGLRHLGLGWAHYQHQQ